MMCAIGIIIAVIIIVKCFQKYKSSGIFVAEQLETIVCGFFKIAEADNVAVTFYGVEYSVSA